MPLCTRRTIRRAALVALICGAVLYAQAAVADLCAYVALHGRDEVALIDTVRNEVTGRIPMPGHPSDVVVSQDGSTAYVLAGGSVAVVDTSRHVVTRTIPVPASCGDRIALSPDGTTLYVPGRRAALSIIDAATGVVRWLLRLEPLSYHCGCTNSSVTFSPDGSTASIPRDFCSAMVIFDTATAEVSSRISGLGYDPMDSVRSPDGAVLYVADSYEGVAAVDLGTGGVTWLDLPCEPHAFCVYRGIAGTPDGAQLYVIRKVSSQDGFANGILVFDTTTRTIVRVLSFGSGWTELDDMGLVQVAFTPDGSQAYVAAPDRVMVLRTATDEIVADIPLDSAPDRLTVASVGGACLAKPSTPPPTSTPAPTATRIPMWTSTPAACSSGRGACVVVGNANARPGERVSVGVAVYPRGLVLETLRNEIAFDALAPIAARANGRPDCGAANYWDFEFLPEGCTPQIDCTAVRARLDALNDLWDGEVLYDCRVEIAAGAPAGAYPLRMQAVTVTDHTDKTVAATEVSGVVVVADTQEAAPEASSGGCAVVPAPRGKAGGTWLLLLALVLVHCANRSIGRPSPGGPSTLRRPSRGAPFAGAIRRPRGQSTQCLALCFDLGHDLRPAPAVQRRGRPKIVQRNCV